MPSSRCEECFSLRQPQIERCPECGHMTFRSQVIGISMVSSCTSCGTEIITAGGFPVTCNTESEFYPLVIIKPQESSKLVVLSHILSENVLTLKRKFDTGDIILMLSPLECMRVYDACTRSEIDCILDGKLLEDYEMIRNCPYRKPFMQPSPY